MYLVGGCVKKLNLLERIKVKWWTIILLSSLLLAIASKFGLEYFFYILTGEVKGGGILVSYISPLIVLIALSMLALFSRISINSGFGVNIIRLISGSAFSVYIIHEQPLSKHQFLSDRFIPFLQLSPAVLILCIIGVAILIFTVCTLIDFGRVGLFKVTRLNRLADAFCSFMGRIFTKLFALNDKNGE
jgi:hypothetical protein